MVLRLGFDQGIGFFSFLVCCGCRTGLEAEAVITCFQDMAAMGQTIEQCRRHLAVAGKPSSSPSAPARVSAGGIYSQDQYVEKCRNSACGTFST